MDNIFIHMCIDTMEKTYHNIVCVTKKTSMPIFLHILQIKSFNVHFLDTVWPERVMLLGIPAFTFAENYVGTHDRGVSVA